MARRRKKESDLDLFLAATWQASAIVAVAGFIAFQWVFPAATAGSPILKMLGVAFKPAGYIVGGIFGMIAVVNFFRQRPVRGLARSDPAREYRPVPIAPDTPTTDQVTKTWEDIRTVFDALQLPQEMAVLEYIDARAHQTDEVPLVNA